MLLLAASEEEAERYARDAACFTDEPIVHLPSRGVAYGDVFDPAVALVGQRQRALHSLDSARVVVAAGQPVHLTPTEFELLRTLISHRGRLMTHATLLREVWGLAYEDDTPLLRAHVANLRRKIEPDPSKPRYVTTDPGIGYRFAL